MRPQFLAVGHAVQDLLTDDPLGPWSLGGAAVYAAFAASRLGLPTALLTSTAPYLPLQDLLPGVHLQVVPSSRTTQFRNEYLQGRRRQRALQRAASIGPDDVPSEWLAAPTVLLAPVIGEVEAPLVEKLTGGSIGLGAQGWLREVAQTGEVLSRSPVDWIDLALPQRACALFVSEEDLPEPETRSTLERWSRQIPTLAFTCGPRGAEVCNRGEWRHIDAFPVRALVDPTGAGDVFAATFLVRLHEGAGVWEAARFASAAASFVVERKGLRGVPDRREVEERLAQHPEIVCRKSSL